jgi:type I restriction enzyme R subunit
MSRVGQKERATQDRLVKFFRQQLNYDYLGDWKYREGNRNIETALLTDWLAKRGVSEALIKRTLRKEVSIQGEKKKRPDIVIYVNGIALGVIELKRSSVSVSEGIRQNLDNQKKDFIRNFFTTMQLVMAGNDTQGLRYGTIETSETHYIEWKEQPSANQLPTTTMQTETLLDEHTAQLCEKKRFLELLHDFIVFDAGIKKTSRHNQFFGIQAAKKHIKSKQGGIIWHTQGSGKSLTMVWLAKWTRENVTDSRVLVITDRTELDEQIEKVFTGVEEAIYRTKSGSDLVATLNQPNPWLMCSLVHKFGRNGEEPTESEKNETTEEFLKVLKDALPDNFCVKGNLFVFVDECHRTQSGKLHEAMKALLPEAMFIGFTGTPLMKKDKKKSLEVFGPYIHTYKFNEAVSDGVVLDLRYEARDIDQNLTSSKGVDTWFDTNTQGLSSLAKMQLKQKWGTMQKVLSSKSRLERIVMDIWLDMKRKPALVSGRGNAMLVCASVHQACVVYDLFSKTDLAGKCAIVTSYQPAASSIKGEESGEGQTEKLFKYATYRKMLADYFEQSEDEASKKVEKFEQEVKARFIKEPGQMRLLIVVDKLLTGFDAPSATYLYIDKKMADHNLFQAICRVNRLDGEDKEYGYIVDYKDLFRSLDKAIKDYTAEAFDGYDDEDVAGLLKDRLKEAKSDLDNALEVARALCEPVKAPKDTQAFMHYFVGESGVESTNEDERSEKEALRLTLYQAVAKLIRSYTNLANEMELAGYTFKEAQSIKQEVAYFEKVRDEVKLSSGDLLEMKRFEPAMRQLLDMYIRAEDSETLMDFEEFGLIDLAVNNDSKGLDSLPEGIRKNDEAMAEAIENNVRKTIVDENPVNPKYFESMATLLDALIKQRREQAISYQEYLEQIRALAKKVVNPTSNTAHNYPDSVDTLAKQALYDNFGKNEVLTIQVDTAVRLNKEADWLGDTFKERKIENAILEATNDFGMDDDDAIDEQLDRMMDIIKAQREYH